MGAIRLRRSRVLRTALQVCMQDTIAARMLLDGWTIDGLWAGSLEIAGLCLEIAGQDVNATPLAKYLRTTLSLRIHHHCHANGWSTIAGLQAGSHPAPTSSAA